MEENRTASFIESSTSSPVTVSSFFNSENAKQKSTTDEYTSDVTVMSVTAPDEDQIFLPWDNEYNVVSAEARELAQLILRCGVQQVFMALGIPGNVLSLCVFAKQGLRDRINLLLFSLAIADLFNLVTQFLLKCSCYIRVSDQVDAWNWEVRLQGNVLYFSLFANFVSGMLIVVMAVDRCISVTLPLKASTILSTRRMMAIIVFIYIIVLACFFPTFFLYTVAWRFDPALNRSIAISIPVDDYAIDINIPILITTILTLIVKPIAVVVVVICSIVSVVKLKQATKRRLRMREGSTREQTSQMSQTELRISSMLLFLCVVYVVLVLPEVAVVITNYFVPEFYPFRRYHNVFILTYEIIFAAACLNSSANFFAYLALSTRFRATLGQMLPCCGCWTCRRKKHLADSSPTILSSVCTTVTETGRN